MSVKKKKKKKRLTAQQVYNQIAKEQGFPQYRTPPGVNAMVKKVEEFKERRAERGTHFAFLHSSPYPTKDNPFI
jgi:hypothetical protein